MATWIYNSETKVLTFSDVLEGENEASTIFTLTFANDFDALDDFEEGETAPDGLSYEDGTLSFNDEFLYFENLTTITSYSDGLGTDFEHLTEDANVVLTFNGDDDSIGTFYGINAGAGSYSLTVNAPIESDIDLSSATGKNNVTINATALTADADITITASDQKDTFTIDNSDDATGSITIADLGTDDVINFTNAITYDDLNNDNAGKIKLNSSNLELDLGTEITFDSNNLNDRKTTLTFEETQADVTLGWYFSDQSESIIYYGDTNTKSTSEYEIKITGIKTPEAGEESLTTTIAGIFNSLYPLSDDKKTVSLVTESEYNGNTITIFNLSNTQTFTIEYKDGYTVSFADTYAYSEEGEHWAIDSTTGNATYTKNTAAAGFTEDTTQSTTGETGTTKVYAYTDPKQDSTNPYFTITGFATDTTATDLAGVVVGDVTGGKVTVTLDTAALAKMSGDTLKIATAYEDSGFNYVFAKGADVVDESYYNINYKYSGTTITYRTAGSSDGYDGWNSDTVSRTSGGDPITNIFTISGVAAAAEDINSELSFNIIDVSNVFQISDNWIAADSTITVSGYTAQDEAVLDLNFLAVTNAFSVEVQSDYVTLDNLAASANVTVNVANNLQNVTINKASSGSGNITYLFHNDGDADDGTTITVVIDKLASGATIKLDSDITTATVSTTKDGTGMFTITLGDVVIKTTDSASVGSTILSSVNIQVGDGTATALSTFLDKYAPVTWEATNDDDTVTITHAKGTTNYISISGLTVKGELADYVTDTEKFPTVASSGVYDVTFENYEIPPSGSITIADGNDTSGDEKKTYSLTFSNTDANTININRSNVKVVSNEGNDTISVAASLENVSINSGSGNDVIIISNSEVTILTTDADKTDTILIESITDVESEDITWDNTTKKLVFGSTATINLPNIDAATLTELVAKNAWGKLTFNPSGDLDNFDEDESVSLRELVVGPEPFNWTEASGNFTLQALTDATNKIYTDIAELTGLKTDLTLEDLNDADLITSTENEGETSYTLTLPEDFVKVADGTSVSFLITTDIATYKDKITLVLDSDKVVDGQPISSDAPWKANATSAILYNPTDSAGAGFTYSTQDNTQTYTYSSSGAELVSRVILKNLTDATSAVTALNESADAKPAVDATALTIPTGVVTSTEDEVDILANGYNVTFTDAINLKLNSESTATTITGSTSADTISVEDITLSAESNKIEINGGGGADTFNIKSVDATGGSAKIYGGTSSEDTADDTFNIGKDVSGVEIFSGDTDSDTFNFTATGANVTLNLSTGDKIALATSIADTDIKFVDGKILFGSNTVTAAENTSIADLRTNNLLGIKVYNGSDDTTGTELKELIDKLTWTTIEGGAVYRQGEDTLITINGLTLGDKTTFETTDIDIVADNENNPTKYYVKVSDELLGDGENISMTFGSGDYTSTNTYFDLMDNSDNYYNPANWIIGNEKQDDDVQDGAVKYTGSWGKYEVGDTTIKAHTDAAASSTTAIAFSISGLSHTLTSAGVTNYTTQDGTNGTVTAGVTGITLGADYTLTFDSRALNKLNISTTNVDGYSNTTLTLALQTSGENSVHAYSENDTVANAWNISVPGTANFYLTATEEGYEVDGTSIEYHQFGADSSAVLSLQNLPTSLTASDLPAVDDSKIVSVTAAMLPTTNPTSSSSRVIFMTNENGQYHLAFASDVTNVGESVAAGLAYNDAKEAAVVNTGGEKAGYYINGNDVNYLYTSQNTENTIKVAIAGLNLSGDYSTRSTAVNDGVTLTESNIAINESLLADGTASQVTITGEEAAPTAYTIQFNGDRAANITLKRDNTNITGTNAADTIGLDSSITEISNAMTIDGGAGADVINIGALTVTNGNFEINAGTETEEVTNTINITSLSVSGEGTAKIVGSSKADNINIGTATGISVDGGNGADNITIAGTGNVITLGEQDVLTFSGTENITATLKGLSALTSVQAANITINVKDTEIVNTANTYNVTATADEGKIQIGENITLILDGISSDEGLKNLYSLKVQSSNNTTGETLGTFLEEEQQVSENSWSYSGGAYVYGSGTSSISVTGLNLTASDSSTKLQNVTPSSGVVSIPVSLLGKDNIIWSVGADSISVTLSGGTTNNFSSDWSWGANNTIASLLSDATYSYTPTTSNGTITATKSAGGDNLIVLDGLATSTDTTNWNSVASGGTFTVTGANIDSSSEISISANAGYNIYFESTAKVVSTATPTGNATVTGSAGDDTLSVSFTQLAHNFLMDGGAGNDYFTFAGVNTSEGATAAVTLMGGANNDTFDVGGSIAAYIDLGAGSDVVKVAGTGHTIDASKDSGDVISVVGGTGIIIDDGTNNADTFYFGGASSASIKGLDSSDTLSFAQKFDNNSGTLSGGVLSFGTGTSAVALTIMGSSANIESKADLKTLYGMTVINGKEKTTLGALVDSITWRGYDNGNNDYLVFGYEADSINGFINVSGVRSTDVSKISLGSADSSYSVSITDPNAVIGTAGNTTLQLSFGAGSKYSGTTTFDSTTFSATVFSSNAASWNVATGGNVTYTSANTKAGYVVGDTSIYYNTENNLGYAFSISGLNGLSSGTSTVLSGVELVTGTGEGSSVTGIKIASSVIGAQTQNITIQATPVTITGGEYNTNTYTIALSDYNSVSTEKVAWGANTVASSESNPATSSITYTTDIWSKGLQVYSNGSIADSTAAGDYLVWNNSDTAGKGAFTVTGLASTVGVTNGTIGSGISLDGKFFTISSENVLTGSTTVEIKTNSENPYGSGANSSTYLLKINAGAGPQQTTVESAWSVSTGESVASVTWLANSTVAGYSLYNGDTLSSWEVGTGTKLVYTAASEGSKAFTIIGLDKSDIYDRTTAGNYVTVLAGTGDQSTIKIADTALISGTEVTLANVSNNTLYTFALNEGSSSLASVNTETYMTFSGGSIFAAKDAKSTGFEVVDPSENSAAKITYLNSVDSGTAVFKIEGLDSSVLTTLSVTPIASEWRPVIASSTASLSGSTLIISGTLLMTGDSVSSSTKVHLVNNGSEVTTYNVTLSAADQTKYAVQSVAGSVDGLVLNTETGKQSLFVQTGAKSSGYKISTTSTTSTTTASNYYTTIQGIAAKAAQTEVSLTGLNLASATTDSLSTVVVLGEGANSSVITFKSRDWFGTSDVSIQAGSSAASSYSLALATNGNFGQSTLDNVLKYDSGVKYFTDRKSDGFETATATGNSTYIKYLANDTGTSAFEITGISTNNLGADSATSIASTLISVDSSTGIVEIKDSNLLAESGISLTGASSDNYGIQISSSIFTSTSTLQAADLDGYWNVSGNDIQFVDGARRAGYTNVNSGAKKAYVTYTGLDSGTAAVKLFGIATGKASNESSADADGLWVIDTATSKFTITSANESGSTIMIGANYLAGSSVSIATISGAVGDTVAGYSVQLSDDGLTASGVTTHDAYWNISGSVIGLIENASNAGYTNATNYIKYNDISTGSAEHKLVGISADSLSANVTTAGGFSYLKNEGNFNWDGTTLTINSSILNHEDVKIVSNDDTTTAAKGYNVTLTGSDYAPTSIGNYLNLGTNVVQIVTGAQNTGYTVADSTSSTGSYIDYLEVNTGTATFSISGLKTSDLKLAENSEGMQALTSGATITGSTVYITSAGLLNNTDVTLGKLGSVETTGYKVLLGSDITDATKVNALNGYWTVADSGTANAAINFMDSVKSAGYTNSDTYIKYSAVDTGTKLYTISGINASGVSNASAVNGISSINTADGQGITINGTTVTISKQEFLKGLDIKIVDTSNATVSGYSIQMDDGLKGSNTQTTIASYWNKADNKVNLMGGASTTGYANTDNYIEFKAASSGTVTHQLEGINATSLSNATSGTASITSTNFIWDADNHALTIGADYLNHQDVMIVASGTTNATASADGYSVILAGADNYSPASIDNYLNFNNTVNIVTGAQNTGYTVIEATSTEGGFIQYDEVNSGTATYHLTGINISSSGTNVTATDGTGIEKIADAVGISLADTAVTITNAELLAGSDIKVVDSLEGAASEFSVQMDSALETAHAQSTIAAYWNKSGSDVNLLEGGSTTGYANVDNYIKYQAFNSGETVATLIGLKNDSISNGAVDTATGVTSIVTSETTITWANNTLTVHSKDLLNKEDVKIVEGESTVASSKYKVALDSTLDSLASTDIASYWNVDSNKAINLLASGVTEGYATSGTYIAYTAFDSGEKVATLVGIADGKISNGEVDTATGITSIVTSTDTATWDASGNTLTIHSQNLLNKEDVKIVEGDSTVASSNYSVALDSTLDSLASTDIASYWNKDSSNAINLLASGVTEGYATSGNYIAYTAFDSGETVATLIGIADGKIENGEVDTATGVTSIVTSETTITWADNTLTVHSKDLLNKEDVKIVEGESTVASSNYKVALDKSLDSLASTDIASYWNVANNSINLLASGVTEGYATSGNYIAYTAFDSGTAVATLIGVKDGAISNGSQNTDGTTSITTSDKTVEWDASGNTLTIHSQDFLDSKDIKIVKDASSTVAADGYSVKMDSSLQTANAQTTIAAYWNKDSSNAVNLLEGGSTTGYANTDNYIKYQEFSSGTAVATLIGLKNASISNNTAVNDDGVITIIEGTNRVEWDASNKILTINNANYLDGKDVMIVSSSDSTKAADGYKVQLSTSVATNNSIGNINNYLTLTEGKVSYMQNAKTAGYTNTENYVAYSSVDSGTALFTINGISTVGMSNSNPTTSDPVAVLSGTNVRIVNNTEVRLATSLTTNNTSDITLEFATGVADSAKTAYQFTSSSFTPRTTWAEHMQLDSGTSATVAYKAAGERAGYEVETNTDNTSMLKYHQDEAGENIFIVSGLDTSNSLLANNSSGEIESSAISYASKTGAVTINGALLANGSISAEVIAAAEGNSNKITFDVQDDYKYKYSIKSITISGNGDWSVKSNEDGFAVDNGLLYYRNAGDTNGFEVITTDSNGDTITPYIAYHAAEGIYDKFSIDGLSQTLTTDTATANITVDGSLVKLNAAILNGVTGDVKLTNINSDVEYKFYLANDAKPSLSTAHFDAPSNGSVVYHEDYQGAGFEVSDDGLTISAVTESNNILTISGLSSSVKMSRGNVSGITVTDPTVTGGKKTITLSSKVLDEKDVEFAYTSSNGDSFSDAYEISLDSELNPQAISGTFWESDATTSGKVVLYNAGSNTKTAGYTADATNNKVTYESLNTSDSTELVTIEGLKANVDSKIKTTSGTGKYNDSLTGITVESSNITISNSLINTGGASVSGSGYNFALGGKGRLVYTDSISSAASLGGSSSNDTIEIANVVTADVTIEAGKGNDSIVVSSNANVSIDGGKSGNDTISLGGGNDTILYQGGKMSIQGFDVDNDVVNLEDKVTISKSSYSNNQLTVTTGKGTITFNGLSATSGVSIGSEIYEGNYVYNSDRTSLSVNEGYADSILTVTDDNVLTIDAADSKKGLAITGNTNNNIIIGTGKADSINANSGNNSLNGGAGNDTLDGSTSDDVTLTGGKGNDLFIIGDGNATITDYTEGSNKISLTGNDNSVINSSVNGSNMTLELSGGNTLVLQGVASGTKLTINDEVVSYGDNAVYNSKKSAVTLLSSASGFDAPTLKDKTVSSIDGSAVENAIAIIGNDKNNVITAAAGGGTLTGGKGNDTLIGGEGDDVFFFTDQGKDVIVNYTADSDMISLTGGFASITAASISSAGDLVLKAKSKTLTIKEAGDQEITFSDGSTYTFGKNVYIDDSGNVSMYSGAKGTYDISSLSAEASVVDGSKATNALKIEGSGASQTISGGTKADTINGGAGDDTINGGAGNDSLNGGAGDDSLTGGDGKDIFAYVIGEGNDTITDYTAGKDKIKLLVDGEGTYSYEVEDSGSGSATITFKQGTGDDATEVSGSITVNFSGTGKNARKLTITDTNSKTTTKDYSTIQSSNADTFDLLYDDNFVTDEFDLDDISEVADNKYAVGDVKSTDNTELATDTALTYGIDEEDK